VLMSSLTSKPSHYFLNSMSMGLVLVRVDMWLVHMRVRHMRVTMQALMSSLASKPLHHSLGSAGMWLVMVGGDMRLGLVFFGHLMNKLPQDCLCWMNVGSFLGILDSLLQGFLHMMRVRRGSCLSENVLEHFPCNLLVIFVRTNMNMRLKSMRMDMRLFVQTLVGSLVLKSFHDFLDGVSV